MISGNTNIFQAVRGLFFILLLSVSWQLFSQPDSIKPDYRTRFSENISELSDFYCFSDSAFCPGKYRFVFVQNPSENYRLSNHDLFADFTMEAAIFYNFLNALPQSQQQNLVQLFSYFENTFETELQKSGLPKELKYLAPAVSGLNMNAIGNNGRAGIWQMTHFQAILNGLQISRLADERFNPTFATRAFAAEMKKNFTRFATPELAVLGFSFGNTLVKNAMTLAGENATLGQVLVFMPEDASQFIGAFQAISVFLSANKFRQTTDPLVKRYQPDTLKITQQLHFSQLTKVLGIKEKQLEFLNPEYRFQIVPGNVRMSKLIVPKGYWDEFVLYQDSVYNAGDSLLFAITTSKIEYPPAPGRQYAGEPVKNLEIEGKTKIKYQLKTGDVLGVIAEKYDVSVEDLKFWNNIRNERNIQAGKTIDIFVDTDKVAYYAQPSETKKTAKTKSNGSEILQNNPLTGVIDAAKNGRKIEHLVKNGESPFTIAKKYEGVTPDDILKWNNIADARKIQPGQKLTVYVKN